jgi:hypothetical protein
MKQELIKGFLKVFYFIKPSEQQYEELPGLFPFYRQGHSGKKALTSPRWSFSTCV